MRSVQQTTLAKSGAVEGAGVHSGAPAHLSIRPAAAGTGVVFHRADLHHQDGKRFRGAEAEIAARATNVIETRRGVTLANAHGASVMTVEHLLAAFAICGVDNAVVDLHGPEVPILDGSAAPFIWLIEDCGLARLGAPRDIIEIAAPMRVEAQDRFIQVEPYAGRLIEIEIDFADPAIGRQSARLSLDDAEEAMGRLGSARTFCTLGEVEAMRAAGLGLGGSLDNALVIDSGKVLNGDGLRDPSEFALHKALDLVGDLSLAGAPILGKVTAFKPGHDLNTRLARLLMDSPAAVRRLAPEARLMRA
ncbi:MAG: UDP-3-O-acyl-N-acetylglucosamine deacetylase [Amphiplicatus sp.]